MDWTHCGSPCHSSTQADLTNRVFNKLCTYVCMCNFIDFEVCMYVIYNFWIVGTYISQLGYGIFFDVGSYKARFFFVKTQHYSKEITLWIQWMTVCQKVPNLTFKVNFDFLSFFRCQESPKFSWFSLFSAKNL